MSINDIIFIDNLPKIDLHGYDYDTACLETRDFVNDLIKMKKEYGVIVHGIGNGIVRRATHESLKKNKKVKEYKTYYNNNGCTIVRVTI